MLIGKPTQALTGISISTFERGPRQNTKIHDRMLIPLTAADQPSAPAELRHALAVIDTHIDAYRDRARLPNAA